MKTNNVLIVIYGGCVDQVLGEVKPYILDLDDWPHMDLMERVNKVNELEEVESLWPQWFKDEVAALTEQYNAEIKHD